MRTEERSKVLVRGLFWLAIFMVAYSVPVFAQTPDVKVEGSAFAMPPYDSPATSQEEYEKKLAMLVKKRPAGPAFTTKVATARTRGEVLSPNCFKNGYYGTCAIYQFVNTDFPVSKTTCGQSALATALWAVGIGSKFNNSHAALVKSIWDYAPPKVTLAGMVEVGAGGYGTDWRQINYGVAGYRKMHNFGYQWVKGFDAVKAHLKQGHPVVIMLDTGTLKQYQFAWGTGHWVVAYGYDTNYIYVTNFPNNRMTWNELKIAWGGDWFQGNLAKAHGTAEMGLAFWK